MLADSSTFAARDPECAMDVAERFAQQKLAAIMSQRDSPFLAKPPSGHMRGIDFYKAGELNAVVGRAVLEYARWHKKSPDLVHPRTINEKIVWSKFFQPFPLPSVGDKLSIGAYVPASLNGAVALPQRVWRGRASALPANDDIEPGDYFLKANHGSGKTAAVRFPLSPKERAEAEALMVQWTKPDNSYSWGEWWYHVFEKEFFLEKSLTAPGTSCPDWKFWVVGGKVRVVQHDIDRFRNHARALYDRDFNYLPHTLTNSHKLLREPRAPKPDKFDQMVMVSEAIGRRFSFARVDLYHCGRLFLGEITLSPGNGCGVFDPDNLDAEMGDAWVLDPSAAVPPRQPESAS